MNPITADFARIIDQGHRERVTEQYAAARRTSSAWKRGLHALLGVIRSEPEPVLRGSARHA